MKLIIQKKNSNNSLLIKSLLLKATSKLDKYDLSEFKFVREYQLGVIRYIEDVIRAIGIGLALKLDVNPESLLKKSFKIKIDDLIKISKDEEVENEYFYKNLFDELRKKFESAKSYIKKFNFNKGKPLEPIQFKGRIIYNPETKRPLNNEEWTQITNDVSGFLKDKMSFVEDDMIVQAALFGKLMQKMESEGLNHDQQKDFTYNQIEERYGVIPQDDESIIRKFGMSRQEIKSIEYAKQHAAEYLSIKDGDLKKKIIDMVRKQIVGGLEDGISAQEMIQRLFWMDPSDALGKRFSQDTIDAINRDFRRICLTEMNTAMNNGYLAAVKEESKPGEDLYFTFSGSYNPKEKPNEACNRWLGKIAKLVDEPMSSDIIKDKYAKYAIWEGKNNIGRTGRNQWMCIPVHPHCFLDGEVFALDGWIDISQLQKGTFVLTHKNRFRPIKEIFRRFYDDDCYEIVSIIKKNGKEERISVRCTKEHPFMFYDRYKKRDIIWVKAENLKIGDFINILNIGNNGDIEIDNSRIIDIVKFKAKNQMVYNLEVEDDHSYIVNGFVVKNCTHYWEKINPEVEEWDDEINKIVYRVNKSLRDNTLDLLKNDIVKRHINYKDIEIDIEWLKGETRTYPGSKYKNKMNADYGYIRKTDSPDGEEIDVYVNNPIKKNSKIYMINQLHLGDGKDGDFDEHKFMLGFKTKEEAKKCYIDTMDKRMFGGILEIDINDFKNNLVKFYTKKGSLIKSTFVDNVDWKDSERAKKIKEELQIFSNKVKKFLHLENPIIVHLYKAKEENYRARYDEGIIILYENTPDWRGDFLHELGHQIIRLKNVSDEQKKLANSIMKELEKNKGDGRIFIQKHVYSNIKEVIATLFKWYVLGKLVNDSYLEVLKNYQPMGYVLIDDLLKSEKLEKSFPIGTIRIWKGGKYQKISKGEWNRISETKETVDQVKDKVEEKTENNLYRNTDIGWLMEFLVNNNIEQKRRDKKFISFSLNEESGSMDKFGDTRIIFNKDKLENQGAIEVYYEKEFMEMYPEISKYITGYKSEKDYYDSKDFNNEKEAIEANDFSWEEYIRDFEHEEEFVIPKIKYEDGLIKKVIIKSKDFNDNIKKLLEKNNIKYEVIKDGEDKKNIKESENKIEEQEGNIPKSKWIGNEYNINYLIHTTDREDANKILNEGFELSKNEFILNGIYSIADKWYERSLFSFKDSVPLKIEIDDNAIYGDNGAERPMDAIRGTGNKGFSILWANIMSEINPKYNQLVKIANKIEGNYRDKGFSKESFKNDEDAKLMDEAVDDVLDNNEIRKEFQKRLRDKLIKQNIDVYQNGGETIIINPKVIKNVSILIKKKIVNESENKAEEQKENEDESNTIRKFAKDEFDVNLKFDDKNKNIANTIMIQLGFLKKIGIKNNKQLNVNIEDDYEYKEKEVIKAKYSQDNNTISIGNKYVNSFIHEYFHHLDYQINSEEKNKLWKKIIDTESYKRFTELDSDNDFYYSNPREVFARLGCQFIYEEIKNKKLKNQFVEKPRYNYDYFSREDFKLIKDDFRNVFKEQIKKAMNLILNKIKGRIYG